MWTFIALQASGTGPAFEVLPAKGEDAKQQLDACILACSTTMRCLAAKKASTDEH